MCNEYDPLIDFTRESNIHELIKGNINGLDPQLLYDYAFQGWFLAIPLLFGVLLLLILPFFCCCYGRLRRAPRDWTSLFVLTAITLTIMVFSIFLNIHLDNPSCHFEQTRLVSKDLLSTLIKPADDVLLTFDSTIKEVKDSMTKAQNDRGASLKQRKDDYIKALDELNTAAKDGNSLCTTIDCPNDCRICLDQTPILTVSDEMKQIPVEDIQDNIDSVDDLLLDAKDSVKDGVKGIKDTLNDVIEFIDGDWKDYSTQFQEWSKTAQDNTWSLWTPYILILLSLIMVGIGVLLGSSCMGCLGWAFMWWFLIIMFFISFVLMLVSYVGLDVCVVMNQPVTEYVKLDNRSSDMVQSCLDNENVIPKDLVDNYEFTDINFNSTESEIDYSGLTNASKILYDDVVVGNLPELIDIRAKKDNTKTKEGLFIDAVKITYQNVKDIENITSDLLDFGNDIVGDFRCTLLNQQYDHTKGSICYLTNTLFFYAVLFFGVSIMGIPLMISSVNLVLSLREYDSLPGQET